ESVAKHFSNASQPLNETINAPIETYLKLNLRKLYEQDKCFAELINLIYITMDKKITAISSIHAQMDKDFPSAFPPTDGPNLQ
ncbi:hypothetical protein Goari_004596, partial [Gossypium aridum]|nr:hypothetical protein [Gossypium aridum]